MALARFRRVADAHPVLVELGVGLTVLCVCLLVAVTVIRVSIAELTSESARVVTDENALEVRRERLGPHLAQVNAIPTPEGLRWVHDADVGECGVDESDGHLVQAEAWFEWEAEEPVAYDEVSREAGAGYVEIIDYLVDQGWRVSKRENLNGMVSAANPDFDSADLVHPSGVTMDTQFLGDVILGSLSFEGAPQVCSLA